MMGFLNTPEFIVEVEKLDKNKNYYVYCRSDNRSSQAGQLLENAGVKTTCNLTGGMMSWSGKKVIPVYMKNIP